MAGDFSRADCNSTVASCFSRNAASCDSPGQRPGYAAPSFHQALKGRHNRGFALSGLESLLIIGPRALPWAVTARPFGATKGGLGYGG
jgi:hypothetical protein